MIVAKTKRLLAANRARIFVAHHGRPDGIGGDAVEAGDQYAGGSERQRVRVAAPRTFAAAHRSNTVNHTKVERARGDLIDDDARHTPRRLVRRDSSLDARQFASVM